MLGLAHLDRYLFGDFLQRSSHPMELYGSSIGSWRHAALASRKPLASLIQLQERYINQRWDDEDDRPPETVVDELCKWVINGYCDDELLANLCQHTRFTTHIVTARGLGLNSQRRGSLLGLGMGLSAIGNIIDRRLLTRGFQRIVFSSGVSQTFDFRDFNTVHVPLKLNNLKAALLASGSIPFLMSGQNNIPGAPTGQYWDGGIIDYHFDLANHDPADHQFDKGNDDHKKGLILYPHFSERIIKGWFDKVLPWRHDQASFMDRVVLLAPSRRYLSQLPLKKIPDRGDFKTMSESERLSYWTTCVEASKQLAEAFESIITHENPLQGVVTIN